MDLNKLRGVFIGESEGLLGRLEKALLSFEKNQSDAESLRTIFQVMHTLKGNAATMGFGRMAELAHHIEDVMEPVKEGKRSLTSDWVDGLLYCLDVFRSLLKEYQEGKESNGVDIGPALSRMRSMLGQKSAEKKAEDSPASGLIPAQPPKSREEGLSAPTAKASLPVQIQEALSADGGHSAKSAPSPMVRVQLMHLDNMMNLVSELVISKSRILQQINEREMPALSQEMKSLERISVQLQEEVLQTRTVPVDDIFQRYVRIVRDISHEMGKEINFAIQDNGLSVDRVLLERINEPLVHILRNSVDHGIENREDRVKAGKNPVGNITLIARHEKNFALVEIIDDGRGIDVEKVKSKAIALGVLTSARAAKMSEQELLYLICHPKLSTKEEISRYSGRGVGMDVVQQTMQSINGRLEIKSIPGKGAHFLLYLPLNLAIIQALLFQVGEQTYGLPLRDVLEIISLAVAAPKLIDRQEVIMLRREVIPVVRLNKMFNVNSQAHGYALVVQSRNSRYALAVDSLLGRQEIVLKNLNGFMKQIKGIGGATVLGDGRAILILDAQGFL